MNFDIDKLIASGCDEKSAQHLAADLDLINEKKLSVFEKWRNIILTLRVYRSKPAIYRYIFDLLFPKFTSESLNVPVWLPGAEEGEQANLSKLMKRHGINSVRNFHAYSVKEFQAFWAEIAKELKIHFLEPAKSICDLSQGVEHPIWFKDAKLNIVDSCFNSDANSTAIICYNHNSVDYYSYGDLEKLTNRIANGLQKLGFQKGDPIGIAMPMNYYAVAIYLGIIKIGAVVVSIADSFSSNEIAIRLHIATAKAVFTQDTVVWGTKRFSLYSKLVEANAPQIIVLSLGDKLDVNIRAQDLSWDTFLNHNDIFTATPCAPMDACNILFSSGTTGDPKAIPWCHITALKCASDAFYHHNIQAGDVLTWPTNLGWMMGPWLVFASFINRAILALYPDVPKGRHFGEFVQNAKVTMLGVVPTLVSTWRASKCMEGLDLSTIKLFSSTGECSNPDDMFYLMSLAGIKPVIEYCGGTEIGGAYISSTVLEPNYPSLFSTPAMGIDLKILDSSGKEANIGEVALVPPSIGLSTRLLNADHHQIYYADMPEIQDKVLRRHGDQIEQLSNGYYLLLGRADDTMNLGGIKISAIEIERTLHGIPHVAETAAIAINKEKSGPSELIIFVVSQKTLEKNLLKKEMQKKINSYLNPLFKIHDIVIVMELPKTASNKIMRRLLREKYQQSLVNK